MKIFQRVLHGLAVVVLGAGLYALIMIVSLLVFLRRMFEVMGVDAEKDPGFGGNVCYLIWGKWILSAVLVLLGIVAFNRKVSWKILLSGLLLVGAGLFYLRWDGDAPQRPHLGLRVTDADPGYRIVMWMSKDSPYSRLDQGGVLGDTEFKTIALPNDIKDWPEHIRLHRDEIMNAWERDTMGREWIDAINACQPAGVWEQGLNKPIIKFGPTRSSALTRIARAYALALEGKRNEAIESLVPMMMAWRHIQRTSPCIVDILIGQVVLKQSYRATGEILKLGEIGGETKKQLLGVLRGEPDIKQVFRNVLMGEYEMMSEAIDQGIGTAYREQLKQAEQTWTHWIAPHVIASSNQTKQEALLFLKRTYELAIQRDIKGLEQFWKKSQSKWYLKNPVGNILVNMATPAYAKVIGEIWEIEDLRLELLKQLEKP